MIKIIYFVLQDIRKQKAENRVLINYFLSLTAVR